MNTEKPSVGAIIGGVIAGSTVNSLVLIPHKIGAPKILNHMAGISSSLSQDEFKTVNKAIENTLQTSGLDKKGVSIIKATEQNADEIAKIMTKEINSKPILRKLPEDIKKICGEVLGGMFNDGKNACYTFGAKKVILPDKLSLAGFHELGHAFNHNLSTAGKILQKSRPFMLLAAPVSLIALFKTKKSEEPKSVTGKVTKFIKENAGKLTFAAFLPVLAEEGLATLRGNSFARKALSPELAKKAAKTNALGFATYLGLAALSSLGVYLGVKVKDKITDRSIAKRAMTTSSRQILNP